MVGHLRRHEGYVKGIQQVMVLSMCTPHLNFMGNPTLIDGMTITFLNVESNKISTV